jgi:hypothetical protein
MQLANYEFYENLFSLSDILLEGIGWLDSW